MARVLVVYHRAPRGQWRSTYGSHLYSFSRFSDHECLFLNTARPTVPKYISALEFDLVIFHYTFLAWRVDPAEFERHVRLIDFIRGLPCRKAIVPHDEQVHADLLNRVVNDFGVTHIFTPASAAQWSQIYRDVDRDAIRFTTVLTGYVDENTLRLTAKRAARNHGRSIDVGYRAWDAWPYYGRHGLLKGEVGRVFKRRAPEYGLTPDISGEARDALLGSAWFDFLLRCKYTVGVEGGSSIFDWDGSIAEQTRAYLHEHAGAAFEQVEAACFPGRDGGFDYFLLGPRHLEAVMTRTCQVLIEGHYGGVLEPGVHYIELKKDFGNLDEVLALMAADTVRADMVEKAYQDVVVSGRWSYRALADLVYSEMLDGAGPVRTRAPHSLLLMARNRVGDRLWEIPRSARLAGRDAALRLLGKERTWRLLVGLRNTVRRLTGRPPLEVGATASDDAGVSEQGNRSL